MHCNKLLFPYCEISDKSDLKILKNYFLNEWFPCNTKSVPALVDYSCIHTAGEDVISTFAFTQTLQNRAVYGVLQCSSFSWQCTCDNFLHHMTWYIPQERCCLHAVSRAYTETVARWIELWFPLFIERKFISVTMFPYIQHLHTSATGHKMHARMQTDVK